MSRRKITTPDAAAALTLAEAGYDARHVERITAVNSRTVDDIVARKGHWLADVDTPVFREWRDRTKREIMGRSGELAVRLLAHADKNLEKTSPYQAIGMYGILRSHDRLDAGEPTEITLAVNLHHAEGLDRLAAILSQSLLPTPNDVSRETLEINPKGLTSDKK